MPDSPDPLNYYAGDGTSSIERGVRLPTYVDFEELGQPERYVASEALRDAVNVALLLGQPLLVTGEPGTGKTQLASSVAYDLGLRPPMVFHAKTTSTARDLFYRYDALGHFHVAHFKAEAALVEQFIAYEALGLAILLSLPSASADPFLPETLRGTGPTRSVVLIDEIDKAPRDLPNDVLNEIENLTFLVRETGQRFVADPAYKPVVILTSNSERNLPDAFLRRCVFFHIPFPTHEELVRIVQQRIPLSERMTPERMSAAITHFERLRKLQLKKPPATAELLAWIRVLKSLDLNPDATATPEARRALRLSYAVLAKSREDRELMLADQFAEDGGGRS